MKIIPSKTTHKHSLYIIDSLTKCPNNHKYRLEAKTYRTKELRITRKISISRAFTKLMKEPPKPSIDQDSFSLSPLSHTTLTPGAWSGQVGLRSIKVRWMAKICTCNTINIPMEMQPCTIWRRGWLLCGHPASATRLPAAAKRGPPILWLKWHCLMLHQNITMLMVQEYIYAVPK